MDPLAYTGGPDRRGGLNAHRHSRLIAKNYDVVSNTSHDRRIQFPEVAESFYVSGLVTGNGGH
jgi:hypothetical protein